MPVSEVAVGDSLWRTNRPTINLYRKKLVRLIVSLSLLLLFKVSYISYTMPRNCVNNPDYFCCICGEVTFSTRKCPLTPMVKKLMNAISVAKSETRTKNGLLVYVVSLVLQLCLNGLITRAFNAFCPSHDMEGTNGPFDRLLFLYTSATSPRNYKEKKKRTVNYPNISSAIRPVPHTEDLPVPIPPQQNR